MSGIFECARNELKCHLEKCQALVATVGTMLYPGMIETIIFNHQKDLEQKISDVMELNIRMTIVAPMKAGKSTIINALIGKECLPTRSNAMTILPIEVVLKQAKESVNDVPRLILNVKNRNAMHKINQEVKRVLDFYATEIPNDSEFDQLLRGNADIIKTAKEIRKKDEDFILNWEQKNEDDIREMLTFLNDLIRIYIFLRADLVQASVAQQSKTNVDIHTAYTKSSLSSANENYDDDALATLSDNIPRLEVIYKPLKAAELSDEAVLSTRLTDSPSTQLILVDTPGPNEAHTSIILSYIVRKQLMRADMVLVTFNYTALNTNDDQSIAQDIESIHTVKKNKDAVYALVNKVDQRRQGDMNEAEVRHHIFKRYNIPENRVFELKAVHAITARRFFAEYEKPEGPSNISQTDIAEQVLHETYPTKWKKKKGNVRVDELVENAKELYEESGLDEFLENGIESLRKQVIHRCFRSALNTCSQVYKYLRSSVLCRLNGLSMDRGKLNHERQLLQEDKEKLLKLKTIFNEEKERKLSEFTTELDRMLHLHKSHIDHEIAALFDESNDAWKNPHMWRDTIREKQFAAGAMLGSISTGAVITGGLMVGAPLAIPVAAVGTASLIGLQLAAHFAQDRNQLLDNADSTRTSNNHDNRGILNNIRHYMAKAYAAVFTNDEARFDTKAEADDFIANVKKSANTISMHYYYSISAEVYRLCESLSNKLFLQLQSQLSSIIEATNERFCTVFKLKRIVPLTLEATIEDITMVSLPSIARYRPYFGISLFEYEAKTDEDLKKASKYCVDRKNLKKTCLEILEQNITTIKTNIYERIEKSMEAQFNGLFLELENHIQIYVNDVEQSLDDKNRTIVEKNEFSSQLHGISMKIDEFETQLKILEKDTESILIELEKLNTKTSE